MTRRVALALTLALMAGCGEDRASSAVNEESVQGAETQRRPDPPEPAQPTAASAEAEPSESASAEAEPSEPVASGEPSEPAASDDTETSPGAGAPPESGCVFAAPVRVYDAPGWVSIAPLGDGFVVAGVARDGDGERVIVSRVGADPLASAVLERGAPDHRRAGPALATSGDRLAVALVDGRRRLMVGELAGGTIRWRALAENASLRFAPSLAADGDGWVIAWTEEGAESLVAHGARLSGGQLRDARELRPAAGGSAATRFLAGASPPEVVFLDPRTGLSVALRSGLGSHGFAEPRVARPINLVTEPPEIAAVRAGDTDWLAYTAVGSLATTAVGLVRLEGEAPPVALVPGTGYGVLHVDAAPLSGGRAVFVADAPRAAARDAPRELHVRVLSTDGTLSDPTVIVGPSGAASRGHIAVAGDAVAVAFADADALYTALGRCR